jgi:Mn-containing catalase
MTDEPRYLGLLRGIANAESDAHIYLSAWRDTTTDPEVKAVLTTVAAREGEHGMAFAKRVIELGYDFERRESPRLEEDLAVARSDRSDREKAEHFRLDRIDSVLSFFDDVFKDHTIDIRTGELLGRYIAEEHDTARLAGGCYANLCQLPASAAATKSKPAARPRSRTTKAKRPAAART